MNDIRNMTFYEFITYVAIWEVTYKEIKLIEVTYAGTHEKAPY
jgi:hypothetical protein